MCACGRGLKAKETGRLKKTTGQVNFLLENLIIRNAAVKQHKSSWTLPADPNLITCFNDV